MSLSTEAQKIYTDLMNICESTETFYFSDQQTLVGTKVRIFSYHMASYNDWFKPSALECRGIMFQMDSDGNPVELLCRPMEKFFNYAEIKGWEKMDNPLITIGGEILNVMIKEDGSLISTFNDGGYLGVKSKASVKSEQVMNAMMVIEKDRDLYNRLLQLANDGYTVNMEYVSPTNRIVIGYEEASVVILNVRATEEGDYVPYNQIAADPILRPYLVEHENVNIGSIEEFVNETYTKEGFEGYVVQTTDGFFKIKTSWYVGLHRTKDSVNSNKELFMNVANNISDDLKQLFSGDTVAMDKILAFEELFLSSVNSLYKKALEKIEETKGMSRKDYAITLNSDTTPTGKLIFGPMMKYFVNTDVQTLFDNIILAMKSNPDMFIPEKYK